MTKDLICVICPGGCALKVTVENGQVTSVLGNACPRGERYAESEIVNPVRTLTTTVKTDSGELLPVKTSAPVPKTKLFEYMNIINQTTVTTPVAIGRVLIYNIDGNGTNVVAAKSMK